MDDAPVIYGLEDFQTRCLTALTAETDKICFLVGTQSLTVTNQVQMIEFDDDTGLVTKRSFSHPVGEIWSIACAPVTASLFATAHSTEQMTEASVWKLPALPPADDTHNELEKVTDLCDTSTDGAANTGVRWIGWSCDTDSKLATLSANTLLLWDIRPDGEAAAVTSRGCLSGCAGYSGVGGLGAGRWYPHQHSNQVAGTLGAGLIAWDTRSMTHCWSISNAHTHCVRDLDFNPNLQYHLATCGDDCCTKFWDLRKPSSPLLTTRNHTHWVWSVRYNASYDQLVLTCSSDQRVVLCNLPSVAATPYGHAEQLEQHGAQSVMEGVVQAYEEHEDSVYAVEWSAGDFWTFASLSYDGRLVINKVPRSVKYKQFL